MDRLPLGLGCLAISLIGLLSGYAPCGAQALGGIPGAVTGRVTDSATGLPIPNVIVVLQPHVVDFGTTDSDGNFQVVDVPPGTYYAWAWGFSAGYFIDEHFDDIPCAPGCNDTAGATPIQVISGTTTTGVDFALEHGGKIGGTVLDEGTGLPLPAGASVEVIDPNGTPRASGNIQGDGTYETYDNLPAGTYFAFAYDVSDGRGEMFRERPCQLGDCHLIAGTPILVEADQTTLGIDFTIGRRGVLDVPLCRPNPGFVGSSCHEANPQLRDWPVTAILDHSGGYTTSNGTVIPFSVDLGCSGGSPCYGLEEFGANSPPSGYRLDCDGTPIDLGDQLTYSGVFDGAAGTGNCPSGGATGATSYLNYDGHSGYDFDTVFGDVVVAAAVGILDKPTEQDPVIGNPETFNALRIRHPNGLETWYLHSREGSECLIAGLCTSGQQIEVAARQPIALAGNTGTGGGSCSPPPGTCSRDHLHFEVRTSANPVEVTDPFGCDPSVAAIDSIRCRTGPLWIDRVYASGFDTGDLCGWSVVVGGPAPCP